MTAGTVYRTRRSDRAEQTREKITAAVYELLSEGSFHEAAVEGVAERAGVSRATLYQHFRSRVDLVDAICDTFAVNPALVQIREAVVLPDPDSALDETIALAVRFWASENAILTQLYGVVAIDPAASDLVVRQRDDRHGEMKRLARHLKGSGRLRSGLSERGALDQLMVLTSYETFSELRLAGRAEQRITELLQ